jgi:hypothetical protein
MTPAEASESLETVVREYRSARDYERDVRDRRREGWRVVSVLQRPSQPSSIRRLAIGWGMARPDTEYLVTYHRTPGPLPRQRPLEWLRHPHLPHLPPTRSAAWVWLLIGLLLIALLLYGFADFFADAVPF